MSYKDITLTCRDCGESFVFTAGEQEFYSQKGFLNNPVRCPDCRRARKKVRPATPRKSYSQHTSLDHAASDSND